ncbi:MAG: 30S ribosomal protein S16 [Pacificimonas sp.]
MAVVIRLSRGGAKKRPYYRVVVADKRAPRDGKYLERIGSYNPLLPKDSEERVKIDVERAKHWLGVGAVPSDRVARFLDAEGLMKRVPSNNPQKGEPGANAKARQEERAEKAAAAEEAKKEADAAAKEAAAAPKEEAPAEEAPAEEAPAEDAKAEEAPAEEAKAEEKTAEDAKTDNANADDAGKAE